mmetsp:Transcript_10590/g.13327  ORF Transcript_10590/g.13327 Transcript_10590/m.13327 type:complete len:81 (+) Transcript_10590:249-491(+)
MQWTIACLDIHQFPTQHHLNVLEQVKTDLILLKDTRFACECNMNNSCNISAGFRISQQFHEMAEITIEPRFILLLMSCYE